ncbi:MAG: biotin synthase BioB [Candidatus Poribacteria bacterium]|nr:biotin synthase BioB [Candidatus Poribacteria bacterium]
MNAAKRRWTQDEAEALLRKPLFELLDEARAVHRRHFKADAMEKCALLSIKTGGCPEDCAYCAQSARYPTGLPAQKLMQVDEVKRKAEDAQRQGATRFCMGAAWRSPNDRDIPALCGMIRAVKSLGMETCMTIGMLTRAQAERLKKAGLDYVNHNIDTSEEHYANVITTRVFQDRLETLRIVREAKMKVCCGVILGLGETLEDRASMLCTLANLPEHPKSLPVNRLMPMPGTPLEKATPVEDIEVVRFIACCRAMMPRTRVRLSAGRNAMNAAAQSLCFYAGANSIFLGNRLLTAENPSAAQDAELFERLGLDAGSEASLTATITPTRQPCQ